MSEGLCGTTLFPQRLLGAWALPHLGTSFVRLPAGLRGWQGQLVHESEGLEGKRTLYGGDTPLCQDGCPQHLPRLTYPLLPSPAYLCQKPTVCPGPPNLFPQGSLAQVALGQSAGPSLGCKGTLAGPRTQSPISRGKWFALISFLEELKAYDSPPGSWSPHFFCQLTLFLGMQSSGF